MLLLGVLRRTQLKSLCAKGLTVRQISKTMKWSVSNTTYWLDRCGLKTLIASGQAVRVFKTGLDDPKCINLQGKRFGSLTVVGIAPKRYGRIFWACKCDCGVTKDVSSKHLRSGVISNCSGSVHRVGKLNNHWKGYEEISGKYWEMCRKRSSDKGRGFDITLKYAWDLFIKQGRRCALTGMRIGFHAGKGKASLDRIDSKKGYVMGNIQWVDRDANRMKWELSQGTFLSICKQIVEFHKL